MNRLSTYELRKLLESAKSEAEINQIWEENTISIMSYSVIARGELIKRKNRIIKKLKTNNKENERVSKVS